MKKQEEEKLAKLSPFEVKNKLIELAQNQHQYSMINAGRGNPDWVAIKPRAAFFQLGIFALEESKRTFSGYEGFGGIAQKDGISQRFEAFIAKNKNTEGVDYLKSYFDFAISHYHMHKEELLLEWVNGIIGDNYPVPDRMLTHSEIIVRAYLMQEMGAKNAQLKGSFDIFAVEGGTAAMVYIFNSLKANKFLNAGDTIAIGAPIFTPYIEMPELKDYDLNLVEINSDENNGWQYPDSEIEKLKDPKIKAFFLVNPMNPPSVKLSEDSLNKIAAIAKERKDLILLTDDVYGTFTENFTSLAMKAPEQTILVYSYSKYFGATGWRLGAIALHKDNMFDKFLANLPQNEKAELYERYKAMSMNPEGVKMIDRFVADSRAVALNHTAGLSTPQQIQMVMFSKWMQENYNALDPVIRFAQEKGVIAMPGGGFDGPQWTLRFSLANSSAETFSEVKKLGYEILEEYYQEFLASK
ncbi:MAG: aspartate 4-decarboxylase [Bacteroidetes bacterium 4572_77]|nr:MAG: aspartate 4-decarboxylase [Bacteroidetes bacterium 4572_77]